MLDNTGNNNTTCKMIQDIHTRQGLKWNSDEQQLPYVLFIHFYSSRLNFVVHSCLGHIVNLGNIDIMGHITKIAAVENATAIWEYDLTQPDNHVLGGSLDVIAAIRMLTIKVRKFISLKLHVLSHNIYTQIQASGQHIEYFHSTQICCGVPEALKIPLHSNSVGGLYCPPVIPAELGQALPELCQAWVVFRGRSWQVGLAQAQQD